MADHTNYPGNLVDLALTKQALDAAGAFPGEGDLALVPARLIPLVRDALTELSWRRDMDDDRRP